MSSFTFTAFSLSEHFVGDKGTNTSTNFTHLLYHRHPTNSFTFQEEF